MAIVSPASAVREEYIDGAARFLRSAGFEPVIMPHAKGPADGSYASSAANRLADLVEAYGDSSVRAILCARGGYGCVHLLEGLDPALISADPKWLIGFSDISALHALSRLAGVVSLHSPMAKHLTLLPPDHYCTRTLMGILTEGLPCEYRIDPHTYNRQGEATGRLAGGNLAVINGLADTPFDPLDEPESTILFIEDVGEQIYEIERMLIRLHLAVSSTDLRLIIGHFTDYRDDRNHADMYAMIDALLARYPEARFPVVFGFPTGHMDDNLPLPLGAGTTIQVSSDKVNLKFE